MVEKEKKVPFSQILVDLADDSKPFPPRYLHRFSDLDRADLALLKKTWPTVAPTRKLSLLQDLEDLSDSETLVCFDEVAKIGLEDPSPQVRAFSAPLLWESEDETLVPIFLSMMEKDVDADARAAGATALGRYIYMGEIEELSTEERQHIEDSLLLVCTGSDAPLVRRRALESLGFSSRPEVPVLIENALDSREHGWIASGLFAISRSFNPKWEKEILKYMGNPDDDIRFEAIRAAGELELAAARQPLLDSLEAGEEDGDNRLAVIWSLSQIGGDGVQEAIQEALAESEDDEEAEYIEEALTNLAFYEDFELADLMDIESDIPKDDDGREPQD